MFNFEKLEVWQKAIDFGDLIYLETRRFPSDERFGLTTQLCRAVTSVSSNIAEGSSRSSKMSLRDLLKSQLVRCSKSCRNRSLPARRQQFLNEASFRIIYTAAEEQSRMLSGLRRSLAPSA